MGKTGGKQKFVTLLIVLFVHAAVRGGTCAFTLKMVDTLIKSSSRDDKAFDLDIESTYGQPASCRARPVIADDGLADIRWIRGLGGENLPAASYALLPDLKKVYFFPSERDRELLSPVFCTAAPKRVCTKRLAGARHVSPSVT